MESAQPAYAIAKERAMEQIKLYSIRLYLEPDPSGVYTITSPDVPGLVTEGRTPTEILNNVQEALAALKGAWEELGM